ncbi:MAG: Uma2 family endonuclease, partial [Armatimonadetes bacterium]|nr:Uma2 family endonuclease [Anaerolineae bacterium]
MIVHEKLSATQFDAFIAQPEQLNRRFELIHGEIVEKMPTQLHGAIIGLLAYFLIGYLRQNPIGYALIEARYRLPGDSENDLIPDLSFVTHAHGALVTQGAAPYMPDLAVEAQSDGQSDKFMFDKAQVYLA